VEEYLEPLAGERVARSWMAFAAAADQRYTLDLMPTLRGSTTPKLLVWGEDDPFQQVHNAERFAAEVPNTTLVRVANAGHIPTENDPRAVGAPLAEFFAKHAASKPDKA
jgi:pimeloyl-ACP methyl ester carboxylesterase